MFLGPAIAVITLTLYFVAAYLAQRKGILAGIWVVMLMVLAECAIGFYCLWYFEKKFRNQELAASEQAVLEWEKGELATANKDSVAI